jgi:hypothetical protein
VRRASLPYFNASSNALQGNDGRAYPVQSLWSNQALNGAGFFLFAWKHE